MGEGAEKGSTRDKGRVVEQRVARYLERAGLEVVARNVEIGGGEIDLVARTVRGEPMVVFVEVRSRRHDERGDPLETVDRLKQRRVIRAATAWLVDNDLWERVAVRFDVVGVIAPEGERPVVDWIAGAFEA